MTVQELHGADLTGKSVKVISGGETKCFHCVQKAGDGKSQKGAVWKAVDSYDNPCAIKFVRRDEYRTHSLSAEMKQSRHLSNRFAQITAYGDVRVSDGTLKFLENDAYAIVVEWVEGQTFEDFCRYQGKQIEVRTFLQLAAELCEALALLNQATLCHNDLHERNIMVVEQRVGPHLAVESHLKIIDTGSLMTRDRRKGLLEKWASELDIVKITAPSAIAEQAQLKTRIDWFSRSDQEWMVFHLVTLVNLLKQNESALRGPERGFLAEVTPLLLRMLDPDHTRRLDNPGEIHQELEMLWKRLLAPPQQGLMTPFDFISAELIRSDAQLNDLFSEKCPWFERCGTTDPIYIYGPRGCGKSTILRKLSLPGVLASSEGASIFEKCPYIGVYISCTTELRSRFWLFPPESYPKINADVILFFSILLAEALLDTLELLRDGVVEARLGRSVGLTHETAREICEIICEHFGLPKAEAKLSGLSWLKYARKKLEIRRDSVWHQILGEPSSRAPDPSVIFDLCKDLESAFPLLKEKHIAFLVDDYSNQRIPLELQRMLNQTISFAKQGNPIFKVSSEYQGVDLDGIQEGREVVEVNLGKEYVDLADKRRSEFLEDVVNIRFAQAGISITVDKLLGRSGISPAVPMARAIREAAQSGGKFYYHGIDTVADICSGDLAMALDLIKQVYMQVKHKSPLPTPIAPKEQHEVIHGYADREHMYLRYFAKYGKEISAVIDALCWLARESSVKCNSIKDKKAEPMVKTHLDIALPAVARLSPDLQTLLLEMQKKGVLFSLDTSRSRIANRGTERFQVRRILLVKYSAPLGRRDPIKLDDEHKLIHLLQDPKNFAEEELSRQTTFRI